MEKQEEEEEEEVESHDTFHSPSADESPPRRPHPPEFSPADSPVSYQTSHAFSPKEDRTPRTPPADVAATFSSPVVVVNRLVRDEPKMLTKMDPSVLDGIANMAVEERGGASARREKLSLSTLKRTKRERAVDRAALAFRICGFLFCLISFSIMASDKNKGWTLDSFHRYKEFRCVSLFFTALRMFENWVRSETMPFDDENQLNKRVICRYCLSVNVIGFLYSGLQGCDLAYQMGTGNHPLRPHLRRPLDFFMDQASQLLIWLKYRPHLKILITLNRSMGPQDDVGLRV